MKHKHFTLLLKAILFDNLGMQPVWPGSQIICSIFGHLQQWKYVQWQKYFIIDSKFMQISEFRQIWSHWRAPTRYNESLFK